MIKRRRHEAAQLSVCNWGNNSIPIWAEKLQILPIFLSLIYNLLPSNRGLAESLVHNFFSFVVWAEQNYRKPLRASHTTSASAILRCVCVRVWCLSLSTVSCSRHRGSFLYTCDTVKAKFTLGYSVICVSPFCEEARGLFCFEELDFILLVYSLSLNLPRLFLLHLVITASRPLTQTTACLAGTHVCIKAFWG